MGGFARRMSYWNAFAKKYPAKRFLRLDGGSIFDPGVAEAPILNRWMLEGTRRSQIDAINLSVWDLPVWRELSDLAGAGHLPKEMLKLPLVSANVAPKDPSRFPQVQPYILKQYPVGGRNLRVGITGLLFDPMDRVPRSHFRIEDPMEAARRVIEEMREKTDYRVVLTDLDLGKAISLAIRVSGIHLLVVSHNYEAISEAQQVGDTLVVIPVNEGRMLSEVRVGLAPGSGKVNLETRFVPLDRTVPDDPAMGELLRSAQKEIDAFRGGGPTP